MGLQHEKGDLHVPPHGPSRTPVSSEVTGLHDTDPGSIRYVVADPEPRAATWAATLCRAQGEESACGGRTAGEDHMILRDILCDPPLPLPGRMLYALQVNLRAGRLPEADGHSSFKMPANKF